jgi:3-hydroxyacyl-CoA dehydrogenase
MPINTRQHAKVREIRFSNPPVNALSIRSGLCREFTAAITAALADTAVESIIVAGEGAIFSGGADIADFEGDPQSLNVFRDLMNGIERASKPIVMAIRGLSLGGGLELALAGHYRVASADAQFGLPEVTLGLLPGGGGTQRLPRLVGARRGLQMMLSGKLIRADAALAAGLIDSVCDGDPVEHALQFIASSKARAVRPTGALAVPADLSEAIAAARKEAVTLASRHILTAAGTALTSDLNSALATEARLFEELKASEPSQALRHVFFGQRLVSRLPAGLEATPKTIDKVSIVGGGLMGTGIAIALLKAGLEVQLVEPRNEAREKAAATVAATLQKDVDKGRLTPTELSKQLQNFATRVRIEEASGADLFIEAVYEDMDVKLEAFRALDRTAAAGAILASNTSALDLNRLAAGISRPQDVVGLHFFSPANIMRLVEIIRGTQTSPETLATAMRFTKRIGKIGVFSGVCDGFIGNRLFEEYLRQAYFLLEEGALPQQVDRALEAWGMAMGPFRTLDLAGGDVGWSVRKRRAREQPDRPYSSIPDRVCELERFGQKTHAGFYLYADGRTAQVDPLIDELVVGESAWLGVVRRSISDAEIVDRCLLALVNEGAKVLAEGIAYRPVDIDIVYVNGYGFSAERGGPMFQGDVRGMASVLQAIRRFATGRHGWAWEPARLIVELADRGGSFASLNG